MIASVPSAREDTGRFEDGRHVRVVGAGVGPDGTADRARDGEAELEAGQAGLLRLGRGARHLDARLGGVALAVDPRALGPDLDHEAADAGIGDDEVAAAAEDEMGQLAGPRETHQRPELVGVVDGREQVGRTTRRAWS